MLLLSIYGHEIVMGCFFMDSSFISYIAGFTSLIAIVISIYNATMEKRRLVTETITKNRIEWIKELRQIMICFAESYKSNSKDDMETHFIKLSFYLNHNNKIYERLLSALKDCFNDSVFNDKHNDNLIMASQDVLSSAWIRMKREAGIRWRTEKMHTKQLIHEMNIKQS